MTLFAAVIVALVACLALADARHLVQKVSGNNNANGAQRVWAVEGSRNMYASLGTSDAIAAAATSGKAYFAAAFGSKAAKATTLRSAQNSAFTPTDGARHLLQNDRTDRADRNIIAAQATADLIQSALSSKSVRAATKAGVQYSKLATSNSARASDFTGARHLLQGSRTDRADRNSIAIQATADLIQSAIGSKSVESATKAGVQYSKLAASNSARASDFTGARHLLQGSRTDRADRNSIAIQATADLIQSAISSKSVESATKAGVQYSKLATSNSVRASDFGAK